MEGHAPAFSANDFFKHEFDSRDENEAVGGSVWEFISEVKEKMEMVWMAMLKVVMEKMERTLQS